jgi:gluconate 2-dehydrogenase gamma chain
MKQHAKIRLELRRFLDERPPPDVSCWQIRKVLAFVHRHLFDHALNVRGVREGCGLRDNNVSCRFKAEVGTGLKAYIDRLRLDAATRLLQDPEVTAATAAHAVGFRHLQTFYRAFRRHLDCTPTAVRAKQMMPPVEEVPPAPPAAPASAGGETALTFEERRALAAAMERILPEDERGAGAIGAGAPEFVDWLTDQSSFAQVRGEMRAGLKMLDAITRVHCGSTFAECAPAEQDTILHQVQQVPHPSARRFFSALVRVTVAGFLCPPEYGGNRQRAGWKFVGYEPRLPAEAGGPRV